MMLEDRGELGPQALADATNKLVAAARKDPSFAAVLPCTTLARQAYMPTSIARKRRRSALPPTTYSRLSNSTWVPQYVNDFNLLGRTYPVFVAGR